MADDCLRIGNMLIARVAECGAMGPVGTDFAFLFINDDGEPQNLAGMLDSVTIRFNKREVVQVEIDTKPRRNL